MDEDLDEVEDGREASIIKSTLSPYVRERIDNLIRVAVSEYRGSLVTYERLLGTVAEISSLLFLLDNLTTREEKGNRAMERIHGKENL